VALLLPVAAVLLAGCSGRKPDERPEGAGAVVTAGTAVATTQAFPRIVWAIGTVTPRPGRFAELAAPSPTRVARIFVTAGQRVSEGDSLVEFERAPFDAGAKSADAALAAAQHAYARAVRLVQAGILPQKDSDQTAADLAQAQATAVLAHRSQQLASVDQTQPLVEVADPAALDVVFNVTPAEAARVHVGAVVTVTAGEGAAGEALGEGVVTAVGAAVDSLARAVPVRASMPRPARSLKIGESVFGRILTGVDAKAVAIPVAALVPSGGDSYQVFVVDSASVAHARPVSVGARTEALAEIATGLEAGETVVTTGAYGVEDGSKIVPARPARPPR